MPPHCDTMDGPVVKAAVAALDADDVGLVLPFVHKTGETEIQRVFDDVRAARRLGPAAREVADRYFFETVVRVHRAGEGAPFTGVKPAGLGVGPVIPLAENAVATGSADQLLDFLTAELNRHVQRRFGRVVQLAGQPRSSIEAERAYVAAVLGFEVYSHRLHEAMTAEPHAGHGSSHEH